MSSEGDAPRKGRIVETREDSAPPAPPVHESPAPETPVQDADAEAVTLALASLRREQRQVIMCTFYGRLSAEDTAARLGMSVRDVKRHAISALREIRRILQQRGVPIPRQPAA
jgi:DNA-directed RNA polymerase specialized sigma24 family protein